MSNTKKTRRAKTAAVRAVTTVCPACRETFVLAHHANWLWYRAE